jgi:hypothetical protein
MLWFFLMGLFCALAAAAIARVRAIFHNTRPSGELETHLRWYRVRLRQDMLGATATAAGSTASGLVHLCAPAVPVWLSCLLATVLATSLIGSIASHGRVANYWQRVLDDLEAQRSEQA